MAGSRSPVPPTARVRSLLPTGGLAALLALGCMCGGGPQSAEPLSADPDPFAQAGTPVDAPVEVPVAAAAAPQVGWSADIQGICQMEADCGCLEKESVEACAASLTKSAIVFTADVNTCIVTQTCASMCGGGGVRCVNEGAARQSAAMSAQHETVMGVLNNFPNGGPCPNGQTQVVDSRGAFVRCQ